MAKAPPPFAPAVLTAQDLRSGAAIFLAATGWTRDFAQALIAWDAASLAAQQARAEADRAAGGIVDLNLVLVDGTPEAPRLKDLRERIRAEGPTVLYAV